MISVELPFSEYPKNWQANTTSVFHPFSCFSTHRVGLMIFIANHQFDGIEDSGKQSSLFVKPYLAPDNVFSPNLQIAFYLTIKLMSNFHRKTPQCGV